MRLTLTLFSLLLLAVTADAQKLTGIWRGYFTSSDGGGIYRNGVREETYKYEIQIDQQSNDGVKGVTYSYKTTVFYGKAELQGIFTGSTKSVVIKETRLLDLKIGDKSEPCLMTCYLDYSRIGKLEVLEGTFISLNAKDKTDCGSGKVYLERVATTEFKLEDFLVKKKAGDSGKTSGRITVTPRANAKPDTGKSKPRTGIALVPPATNSKGSGNLRTRPTVKPNSSTAQKPSSTNRQNTTAQKPAAKSGGTPHPPPPTVKLPDNILSEKNPDARKPEPTAEIPLQEPKQQMPVPKVLVERETKLERVFTTSEQDLEVVFYDNGEIDNDTISVYHNNKLVVSHGRLTYRPISVHIKSTKTENRHELVVVAENLGEIPPNTTLLVLSPNSKERKEIVLTSTERKNAKVIINYVPKE